MIPIRDTIPTKRPPVVTWALITLCVAVYSWQGILSLQKTGAVQTFQVGSQRVIVPVTYEDHFVSRWGARPRIVLTGKIEQEKEIRSLFFPQRVTEVRRFTLSERFAPLLTSLFLHGSFMHLVMNLLFLSIFADNIEDRLGSFRFLLFYLGGGIFATLTHVATNPSSIEPVIGASGAISAVLGAYLLLYPFSLVITFIIFPPFFFPLPAMIFLGFWFFTQLTSGLGSFFSTRDQIAWWAHIGGFVYGAVLTFWNYPEWRTRYPRFGRGREKIDRAAAESPFP